MAWTYAHRHAHDAGPAQNPFHEVVRVASDHVHLLALQTGLRVSGGQVSSLLQVIGFAVKISWTCTPALWSFLSMFVTCLHLASPPKQVLTTFDFRSYGPTCLILRVLSLSCMHILYVKQFSFALRACMCGYILTSRSMQLMAMLSIFYESTRFLCVQLELPCSLYAGGACLHQMNMQLKHPMHQPECHSRAVESFTFIEIFREQKYLWRVILQYSCPMAVCLSFNPRVSAF